MKFGEIVKNARIELGLTLRECARELNVDASNLSKVERGVNQAPLSEETLSSWADFLDITGDARTEFMDAAAASRGEFPPDIAKDENLLAVLPAFLRLSREVPAEEIQSLLESIRSAHTPGPQIP